MKKLIIILSLGMLVVDACKKNGSADEEQVAPLEVNSITYNGSSYTIEKGREWTYKKNRYPTHNSFAYFMWNGNAFPIGGDYDLTSTDPPISIFFYLSLPASSGYMDGEFVYQELPDDWHINGLPASAGNKQVFTGAVVGFDANKDKKIAPEEMIKVIGGSIIYHGSSNTKYNLTLENGKTLKGSIRASVVTTNPPA